MLKDGIFVDVKAFSVCSFAIGIRGTPFVWGKPYRNMRNTDVLAAPVQVKLSSHTKEFMKSHPFEADSQLSKQKKRNSKYISESDFKQVDKENNVTRTIFCKIGGKDYNYLLLDIRGRVFSFGEK